MADCSIDVMSQRDGGLNDKEGGGPWAASLVLLEIAVS
jgi:hypothetical protein